MFGEDTYGSLGLGGETAESVSTPPLSPESLYPSNFGTIPPSDPAAERRNATINLWKMKGTKIRKSSRGREKKGDEAGGKI